MVFKFDDVNAVLEDSPKLYSNQGQAKASQSFANYSSMLQM